MIIALCYFVVFAATLLLTLHVCLEKASSIDSGQITIAGEEVYFETFFLLLFFGSLFWPISLPVFVVYKLLKRRKI